MIVAGVEEGLLPHYYSSGSAEEVEEERRLLYVAMTRAKKHLVLTHAAARGRWGKLNFVEPSRFLDDLPDECRRLAPSPQRRPWRGAMGSVQVQRGSGRAASADQGLK